MIKKTKIVSTLGPATNDQATMVKLIEAGINVARFNFSHGSHDEHQKRFDDLVAAREETGKMIATLLDLKGPEVRTGVMSEEKLPVAPGHVLRVSMDDTIEGDLDRISVSYPDLINDVDVGNRLLIDDGLVELLITGIDRAANELITEVLNHGVLESRKGVNVPNVSINLPSVTDKDVEDIKFGVKAGFDYIAQSFVRHASDVLAVREILQEEGDNQIKIVSKIENQEGVDNIEEILEVSDAIMVARGDLGVEIPTEEVPIVQKDLIKKCNHMGKPVITATQMLDSMEHNPRPTRAEAGDVANAIFDGTDAVMLSGETAAGDYPVEAVRTMANICLRTEDALIGQDAFTLKKFDQSDMTEAIGQAVGHTVRNLGIRTIVAATSSGYTAHMISKYRPNANIIAASFDEKSCRTLALAWGVDPYVIKRPGSTDEMRESAIELSTRVGLAQEGDLIAITAGIPVGESGTTNLMIIESIGTKLVSGEGVGRGNHIGKAVIAKNAQEAIEKVTEGSVLITQCTNPDYGEVFDKVGALIIEDGGITSHAAIMGLEYGIPVIVAAEGAMEAIEDGQLITVDARRGLVYRGSTIII